MLKVARVGWYVGVWLVGDNPLVEPPIASEVSLVPMVTFR